MNLEVNKPFHVPVLLNEVLEYLAIQKDVWYIDATAGGGGHTRAILDRGGKVLAIDQDQKAIDELRRRFKKEIADKRIIVEKANFAHLEETVGKLHINEVKGILLDLGMSTYQIKKSGRGFSFLRDEPLDMRMSAESELTAEDVINQYPQQELYEIFRKFGEENLAQSIAITICRARAVKPITTTEQLGDLVAQVYALKRIRSKIHPATKLFQALRIAVNQELESLNQVLPQAVQVLETGGRLAVISFHSLEDRIIKQYFQTHRQELTVLTKRPVTASSEEQEINHASRSAKLRVAQKN